MASDEVLTGWLRAEIEADARSAAAKLRLSRHSDKHRQALMEKLGHAKAELAILDVHGDQAPSLARLLAFGYRHRDGCPEPEDELRNFYYLCTEPES